MVSLLFRHFLSQPAAAKQPHSFTDPQAADQCKSGYNRHLFLPPHPIYAGFALDRSKLFSGLRVTSLATLLSRVLGMLRDIAMAALFGLVGGGVMDALVVAVLVPKLCRRLFGEGA